MDGVIAGCVAGAVTTAAMHPFDVVKVRLQVNQYLTFSAALEDLWRSPLTEAYRGLTPNLLGNAVAWGAYFGSYEVLQGIAFGDQLRYNPTSSVYLFCSFAAGIWTQAITNPIWVVKTRILGSKSTDKGAPASLRDTFKQIYQQAGLMGFWRGFLPGTLGTAQSAAYFALYGPLKPWIKQRYNLPDPVTYFISSAIAKSIAATVMYPHQVLRSRMQFSEVSLVDAVKTVWAQDGWRGFYKGLSVNLARVVPAMAVTLLTYETTKDSLGKSRAD
uniref:Mitochondrial Flx1 n=1 Tax=Starmerella bombicola TaxID=75736 RepID=A0A6M8YDQ8_STABO|nr:mitochondrial Flx1 [Starmerella bombicola]